MGGRGLQFYSILRDIFYVEYLQDEYGRVCLKMFQVKFVGLQPTVIASRASPPLLDRGRAWIVDARRPSK